MSLVFHNTTENRLYTAWGMYYPNDCSGRGDYVVKGWFWIESGAYGTVSTDDMRGPSFWAYAQDDLGHIWSGSQSVATTNNAFERCVGDQMSLNPKYFKVFPRESSNQLVHFNG
jgi:uncharacterized membrane protein